MKLFSKHQEQKTYYNTGEVETIFHTLNDQKDGPLKIFYKNGQIKTIVNYKKGVQVDEIVNSFDENGKLIRTIEIKNNEINGTYKEFYSDGSVKCEGIYKDSIIIEKKAYYENSILKYHYIKSENESESKIFDENLNYIKNNLEQLPKFSVLYTSNNDFDFFLFDTYESAQIKFESLSNKILNISKKYKINEINNLSFIETVELCELLEILQTDVSSLISVNDKKDLMDYWYEIHSKSSHRHLSKFTTLINDDIELKEFEGRAYFSMSDLQQNSNYISVEYLHVANSTNFIEHKNLTDKINSIKQPTISKIESIFSQYEYKNLFIVLDTVVSYFENKLTENNNTIDDFFEDNLDYCITIIFDYLYRNEIHDFIISDIMIKFDNMCDILETEIVNQKDKIVEDIKIAKAHNHNLNLLLLINEISLLYDLNLLELDFIKYKKDVSTNSIVNRLEEINSINKSNFIDYNRLENLFKSILLDIENYNIKDVHIKNDLLYFDYAGEKIEINIENLYFDYCTSLYYQDKYLNCLVACEHLINKFPNTNNSNLFGIMGELYMQISRYDKAAINYNLCITNLFNKNYSTDFSTQILHFCNRAQSFIKLFEDENQYIKNIINDLEIYIIEYPGDLHVKKLYEKIKND